MNPYPNNWALLVKIIGQHKPYELKFTETEQGLDCRTDNLWGASVSSVVLSRPGFTGEMLRFEVTALLEPLGYSVADGESGVLVVRREKTTMAAEPVSPVMVLQQLLIRHQPKRIFLIWHAGGARMELISTLLTPLYRHPLVNREAANKIDTYLRSQGWRVTEENIDPRGGTEGDRQYER